MRSTGALPGVSPPELARISPPSQHFFFGYYDVLAWRGDESRHLYHRVDFADRLPGPDDVAELGEIDLESGELIPFAETTAWNFQQGSMLQYRPGHRAQVLFNQRAGSGFEGVLLDLSTAERDVLDRPVANVDPTGRYALSLSFERLFWFRPGYGYHPTKRRPAPTAVPPDDGVYLIDLGSGRSRLILSIASLWEFAASRSAECQTVSGEPVFSHPGVSAVGVSDFGLAPRVLVNHITFNTDGSRFVLLLRFVDGNSWKTAVVTSDLEGKELHLLSPFAYASHYHWRDSENIAFYANLPHLSDAGEQLYQVKDQSSEAEIIDPDFFLEDGHCLYSPDRTQLLYDSYPFRDGLRHFYTYNLADDSLADDLPEQVARRRGVGKRRLSLESKFDADWDVRCDLHARWSPTGTRISMDSTHEGFRGIYVLPC